MKLSFYCSHDVKMIMKKRSYSTDFYQSYGLFGNFATECFVSVTPLAVFSGF